VHEHKNAESAIIAGKRANVLVPNVGDQPQMTHLLPTQAVKVLDENAVNWNSAHLAYVGVCWSLEVFWTLISETHARSAKFFKKTGGDED
jgi:hypothetical protein